MRKTKGEGEEESGTAGAETLRRRVLSDGPPRGEALVLNVGGIRVALYSRDRGFFRWVRCVPAYEGFIEEGVDPIDAGAAVRLRFRRKCPDSPWFNRRLKTATEMRSGLLRIRHRHFLGCADPGFGVLDAVLPGRDIFCLDNLLRVVLSVHAPRHRGVLLHAASVKIAGSAYLFYGTSGSGKSTAARKSIDRYRCLAEDATLVRLVEGVPHAFATPLVHYHETPPRPGRAPVRGFFRLAKTPRFTLRPLGGTEAARSLMTAVLLYTGFHIGGEIFDLCARFAGAGGQYEMGSALAEDFWPTLLDAVPPEGAEDGDGR